ncbi:AHH domain-containing protein [Aeribacillus composti]|uniref:AHH domain-containing protein n=1 Tax=Aeribacillus composti TaxID=1868734 RepID=UPI00399D0DF8
MLLIISKKYTPQIEAITKKYGLDLDDVWNIELQPHHGRHPNAYHEYVLSNIRTFDKIAKGDKRKFLRLFEQVKQEIRKNPEMLYKDYWRKK